MPGVFEISGMSKEQRRRIHLWVCLPVRLGLTVIVTVLTLMGFRPVRPVLFWALAMGVVAVSYKLYTKDRVWWDRRVHWGLLVAMLGSLALGFDKIVLLLLWGDLAYSFFITLT